MKPFFAESVSHRPLVVPNGKLRRHSKERGQYILQPTEIRTKRRIYLLSKPLVCFVSKQDDCWIAENEEFMIVGSGTTRQAAEEEFAECFSELYNAYAEHHAMVSPDAVPLQSALQSLVTDIYEATQK